MLLLKNILFTIVAAGIGGVLLPYWILSGSGTMLLAIGIIQYFSVLLGVLGLSIYFRCLWAFARTGRGTPAPIDAPKVRVVEGLYRYVRNPIYLGVLLLLIGEAGFFETWRLLIYAVVAFLFFHFFVVWYEEPNLPRKFGEPYKRYCQHVSRWIPGRRYTSAA